MRRTKIFAFSLAAIFASLAAPALAAGITVPIDQAKIVTFAKPVSTVYVGNPSMADVTVIDSKRIFVLGKSFGTTNLIAMDKNGELLSDYSLTVLGHASSSTVTLDRGAEQYTFACAAQRCEPAPVPGDNGTFYGAITGADTQRQGTAEKDALSSK